MSISETLKQKIDEFDLDRRFNDLAIQTERGVNIALDRASEWADQHRSEIAGWIDKAGATVDDKTDGKYAEHVAKVKTGVSATVTKLADRTTGSKP